MNDEQPTIDDVWINRLAMKLGVLTAQNERLIIENESLTEQLKQLQPQQTNPISNGQHEEAPFIT
jgi:hypothetical protein